MLSFKGTGTIFKVTAGSAAAHFFSAQNTLRNGDHCGELQSYVTNVSCSDKQQCSGACDRKGRRNEIKVWLV